VARPRRWTDEDLIAALDGARSIAEVVRRLRLAHGGAAFVTVRTRMEQLGLALQADGRSSEAASASPDQGSSRRENRRWSDRDLREAVADSRSLHQVFERLDLTVGGSQWEILRARIVALGCDTRHWKHPLHPAHRGPSYATALETLLDADLAALVVRCASRAEVLRAVGLEPSVTTYRALREALSRVETPADARALHRPRGRPRRPLEEILVAGSDWTNTSRLRDRLIDEGVRDARCAICGLQRWRDGPAPLQLDHIDGDRRNNQLTNLRILCANCHAQTSTWCSRNRGRSGRSRGTTR
jgi:5-methylcytosine-specific restriction endonuclease McrA